MFFDIENKNEVIPFDEIDPYNPQNKVRGYINRRQGSLYGSLIITHINDIPCEQYIYATPKMHYPFDKNKVYTFPPHNKVEIYEKLDGTNILSYMYHNNKKHFLTFKTRLRPFLGSGQYGNFKLLWDEILEKYPSIKTICHSEAYNFSFELYGKRNKILVEYDVPLDAKFLFARDTKTGYIYSPESLNVKIPSLNILFSGEIVNEELYITHQKDLTKALEVNEETQTIRGKEGTVWYFITNNHVEQIKCKPDGILKYHWSPSSISYESIYTTCVNAFENFDNPSYSDITTLLEEEFTIDKIEKSNVRINKILEKVRFDKKLQFEIVTEYKKLGVDINTDKATVMRHFAKLYDKENAKRIYTLLNNWVNRTETKR
jgi:hypothetical protein